MPVSYEHISCGGHLLKPSLKLKAGRLRMLYENGSIRYISSGRTELIRMIYSAVRDGVWLTINPVITSEKIDIKEDSFSIEYDCIYRSGEINFSAKYQIEGLTDNSLVFSFEGEALESFKKSRIGFCVLHPAEGCAGNPCTITHSDSSIEESRFPLYINPHQPFLDIKEMRWDSDGMKCSMIFSGDIFETEDQRNWTDASFKTYCTPQSMPCPVTIEKGEKISQKVVFKAEIISNVTEEEGDLIRIHINPESIIPLPKIGIGRSTRQIQLTENEITILKNLKFDHYRTDIYMFNPSWKIDAEIAVAESVMAGYSLELVLFFDESFRNQTNDFMKWVSSRNTEISVITILHKSDPVSPAGMTDFITGMIRNNLPGVKICYGTNANFAQLNSSRPWSVHNDLICYSVHPQEHASDNTTIVENLKAQSDTVESARQFSCEKGIWISPVNLQRRFNANIENFETPVQDNSFPPQVDSRIMSLFGACWTTGSLKYICESGATGTTYFETTGERGIIQGDFPPRWPDRFRSAAGMIFPVAFVFKFILEEKSFGVVKCRSSKPLNADCLVLSDGKNTKIIAANFTSVRQELCLDGVSGHAGLRQLNAGNFSEAVSGIRWLDNSQVTKIKLNENLIMEPYSINFINTLWRDENS